MAEPKPALRLDLDQARAVCTAAQGLRAGTDVSLTSVLEQYGFVRTLGGVEAYLAFLARLPGLDRPAVDAALRSGAVKVVPAVRGCMYVVPRSQVPLALRAADWLSRSRREREQAKAGIEVAELEALGKAVIGALASRGPMTTDALRRSLPEGSVRSLGAAGKKLGLSSPLPSALRQLEFDGSIERTPFDGRLDHERYLWQLPAQDPFTAGPVPRDPAEAYSRLAELFFGAAGVSTQADFAAWAGLSQRDAKAAMASAGLLPVLVEGKPFHAPESLPSRLGSLEQRAQVEVLLPFEDNLVACHGGPALLVDAAHHGLPVPQWGSGDKTAPLGEASHMQLRPVLSGDRIVGVWDYDPDARTAVVGTFEPLGPAERRRIDEAAERVGLFLDGQLGHGRSFLLDTDESLRERVAFVRKLG